MTTHDNTSNSRVTVANTNCVGSRSKSHTMLFAQIMCIKEHS